MKSNKTPFFYVLYTDKKWFFDQSEHAGLYRYYISINLLVVYRESVNLISYITRRLSADSLQQDSCSRDCIRDPLSNLNQYTWREWHVTFEPDET